MADVNVESAILGFFYGAATGLLLWMPFVFAPVALLGASVSGWAMSPSVWFCSFLCGVMGAAIGWRHNLWSP